VIDFDISAFQTAMTAARKTITEAVGESTLRTVAVSGAEIFRNESKRNLLAHSKSFTIYNNVIIKRLTEESDGGRYQAYLVTVRSGPRGGGDAYYWRWFANGHQFVPRNKKVSKKTGKKVGWKAHRKAAEIEYGTASAPAYPFMRPAYESKKQEVVDAMTRTLAEQIARNSR
jgi:HK97 gp10 family phage protein